MSLKNVLVESLKKKSGDWAATTVIGFLVWLALMIYTPTRDAIIDRWNLPYQLQEQILDLQKDVAKSRADIQALRTPSEVIQISPALSRPVEGFCNVPGECEIEFWARRVAGTEECRLVPGQTEYLLTTKSTGVRRKVSQTDVAVPVENIGLDWEPILVTLKLPSNVPAEDSILVVVNYYIECTQEDGVRVRDESAQIEIELR